MTVDVLQGCFVSVHVRRPTLQTQLSWAALGLEEAEGLAAPPSARPPSDAYRQFAAIESRMRTVLKRFSTGGDGGFRYMKFSQWETFKTLIEPLREEYHALVEPFLASYNESRKDALDAWRKGAAEMAAKLGQRGLDAEHFVDRVVAKLERAWPLADELRGRFSAEVRVLFFAVPDEAGVASGTVFDGVISEARERARSTLDAFLAEAQGELYERAVEVVRRMHSVLVNGSALSERSINPLREFVEQFRQLSLSPSDDYLKRLEALVGTIDERGGAAGLRGSTEAWAEVRDLLDEVASVGENMARAAMRRSSSLADRMVEL